MSFEKVNVNSLKQALQYCKNNLKTSKIKELASDVASDNSWQTDSKNQLKQALNTLANTRYKELEKTLDKYIQAASKIDQYQDLERENKQLLQQNQSLNTKLYYTEYYKEKEEGPDGEDIYVTHSRRVKDYSVQNRMNQIEDKINENKRRMNTLKNEVSNQI